jgi:hypothetical protein
MHNSPAAKLLREAEKTYKQSVSTWPKGDQPDSWDGPLC